MNFFNIIPLFRFSKSVTCYAFFLLILLGFVMKIVKPHQIYTNTEEKDELLRIP